MSEKMLPNFIIAGVNKAGTTSVFQYLNGHSDVCNSRDKETGYFLPFRYGKQVGPFEGYTEQFLDYKNQKIIMEATPGYFFGGFPLAQAIKKSVQPDCKILIIFREPVSRLISFYRAKKKSLELERTVDFKTYIEKCMKLTDVDLKLRENNKYTGISSGIYINHINDWLIVFGSNLKIVFFDDLNSNPKKFMAELCDWLQIDAGYFSGFNFEVENKTYSYKNRFVQKLAVGVNMGAARFWRKNPVLKKWIRKQYFKINKSDKEEAFDMKSLEFVREFYKLHNLKLKNYLIDKDVTNLPAWLNS